MNIAFIAKCYDTVGGVERNLFELTRLLAAYGHEIHVYSRQARCPAADGVQLHRIPSLGFDRTAILWSVAVIGPYLAYRGGHDVVISFARTLRQDVTRNGGGAHPVFLQRIAAADSRFKRFLRAVDPYHRSTLYIERKQYSPGRHGIVVANAEQVRREIINTYRLPEEDVQVIHNGVNTELFHPGLGEIHRTPVRREYQLPADAPVVIFVGSGFRRKGLDYLLQAMARLREHGLHALIVGTDPLMRQYKEKAVRLGIGDRVRFVGPQASPNRFYAAADFFSLPSLHEPFGHSTMEALACGLPVIGSRYTGASDLLTGDLVQYTLDDPSDIDALSERMERLLDPRVRADLKEQALRVSASYTLEANARAFERLCREGLRV